MKINVTRREAWCIVRVDALTMEHHERDVWAVFAMCVIAADHVIPSGEAFGAFPHACTLSIPLECADAFMAEFRSLTNDWAAPVQIVEETP